MQHALSRFPSPDLPEAVPAGISGEPKTGALSRILGNLGWEELLLIALILLLLMENEYCDFLLIGILVFLLLG
ncbi:MAG TPA: hypothetical protein DD727_08645 [Clostridiales bacterium]|nr:hypothetical protein [Clostridiales bacterium]